MRNRQPIPRSLPRSGFSYQQARAAGIGKGRLYLDDVRRPFRGVAVVGGELSDHRDVCLAYRVRMRPTEYFSHESAALLHGLPLPQRVDARTVHTSVFAPARAPKAAGLCSHELDDVGQTTTEHLGLRSFSSEESWGQLRSTLSVTDLVVVGDYLVTGTEPYSGEPPPSSLQSLEAVVGRLGRRRGVRNLREALTLVRYGSLSPQETRLRLAMLAAGLPEPALNLPVHDARGKLVAMIDLAYPEALVAIEYLGDHHRTDRKTYDDDIRRREMLTEAGWSVVFVTSADLSTRRDALMRRIRSALTSSTGSFPK